MFDVRHNIRDFERGLSDLGRKQLPWAFADALTLTAESVVKANKRGMQQVFDRPTRWTLNAFWRTKATPRRLRSEVKRKSAIGRRHYLEVQETGGVGPPTGMELAFRFRLPYAGQVGNVTPAARAPRDAFGNLARSEISRIFSQVQASQDSSANETSRSRARRKKRGGATYFVPAPGQLSPGVWRRQGKSLKPVLHFQTAPRTYRPRLGFYARAEKVAAKMFPKHLARRFDEKMARAMSKAGGARR